MGAQVAVSCNRSPARNYDMKDSLANILQTEEFVVNIISTWFLEAANHTCGNYDPDVDEFDLAGLTQVTTYFSLVVRCQHVDSVGSP